MKLQKEIVLDCDNKTKYQQNQKLIGDTRQWTNWISSTFYPKPALNARDKYPLNEIRGSKHCHLLLQKLNYQVFTDSQFPPSIESLVGYNGCQSITNKQFSEYEWARPDLIFSHKNLHLAHNMFKTNNQTYNLFCEEEQAQNQCVKQGLLGNCYFLSAVASLMHSDFNRIKKLFAVQEINSQGIYCIALCLNGI